MKKACVLLSGAAFLALLALAASAQQNVTNGTDITSPVGQKILGYDVAPGTGQDGQKGGPVNVGPTGTGLGVYKGMAWGKYQHAYNWEDVAFDFGTNGVWIYDSSWHQISGVNPDTIISGHFKSASYDEIIGDFGSVGLWMWQPGASVDYPGIWTMLSGVNAAWMFATDEDGDGVQEMYVNFGTLGVWRYSTTTGWLQASGLNPYHGMRMDNYTLGLQEGCFCFPSVGVWRLWAGGVHELTGTVTAEDDHASAEFTNGAAEDLVMDFAGLGLWLLTSQSWTDWHQISTDNVDRLVVAQLGTDNPGLIIRDNYKSGLWYWHYSGSFPGTEVQINATSPDDYGFVEPFQYTTADSDEELAVDMGANGLYVYEYYGGTWTQISTLNPVQITSGDWGNTGENDYLVVSFGPTYGTWMYTSSHTWTQLSGLSPDYAFF
jgi:hypothetical protein